MSRSIGSAKTAPIAITVPRAKIAITVPRAKAVQRLAYKIKHMSRSIGSAKTAPIAKTVPRAKIAKTVPRAKAAPRVGMISSYQSSYEKITLRRCNQTVRKLGLKQ